MNVTNECGQIVGYCNCEVSNLQSLRVTSVICGYGALSVHTLERANGLGLLSLPLWLVVVDW